MTAENVSDLAYADTLWKAADALRGQVDAAEYKHVVLGLHSLKYISDSFQSRRDELQAKLTKDDIKPDQIEKLLESRDEYTAERVFWVPPESRWPNLQNQATRRDIATLIDDAILAVERDNPNLKSKLPRDYDPACGSGGMFVQSEKFAEAHGGNKTDVSIFGQESNIAHV